MPKGNPIRGSTCNPKGKTMGVGTGAGRAPVIPGKAFPKGSHKSTPKSTRVKDASDASGGK
jgi:hypothetical protein